MTKKEAYETLMKAKPGHKITDSYELKDRFVFVCIPKNATGGWVCNCTYVYKNDGHLGYGIPTPEEYEGAIR